MLFNLKVVTNAKTVSVKPLGAQAFLIRVKSKPVAGEANAAVLTALSAFLKVPRRRLKIIRGLRSRHKVISVF